MRFEFDISIPSEEEALLREALGLDAAQDLQATLNGHFTAACHEYLAQYCGQRVFRRGSDFLEYRLALLVRHAFQARLPDEEQVARLFQLTLSESRSLLRSLLAKYKGMVWSGLTRSLKDLLEPVTLAHRRDDGSFRLRITSTAAVMAMNQQLATADGQIPPVRKLPGSLNLYVVDPAAMDLLRLHVDLPAFEEDE
jgi:hypothetical protein